MPYCNRRARLKRSVFFDSTGEKEGHGCTKEGYATLHRRLLFHRVSSYGEKAHA